MWPISPDPVDPSEAIAWMRGRAPVTRTAWDTLNAQAREKAFTVSGVAQLDLVTQAWSAADDAVKNGTTLDEFKKAVGASLEAAWSGDVENPAWRLETIFRTNTQLAYSRGRFDQMTDPDVLEGRPFWMYDAILDGRTTEICSRADGTTLPADHPFWATHFCPAHFNCRSAITTLSEEEAHEQGVTPHPPKVDAEPGFGLTPSAANEWKPDPKDYPKELWKTAEAKPVPAPDPVPTFTPGVHATNIRGLKGKALEEITSALDANALKVLEKRPLTELAFPAQSGTKAKPNNGQYQVSAVAHEVAVSTKRAPHTFGTEWKPGETWSISSAATTAKEATQRTLVHEVAHHIHMLDRDGSEADKVVAKAFREAKTPITRYAKHNRYEYFAESYAAYVFEIAALKLLDPTGFAMVEAVLRLRGVLP